MDDAPQEIELKFLVEPSQADGLWARLVDGGEDSCAPLTSVYFDTPRRALKLAGYALRLRRDDRRWMQTLKGEPVNGGLARGEWENETAFPVPDASLIAKTPAGAIVKKGEALQPLFTVAVQRRMLTRRHGGATIELALDRGEVAAGEKAQAICELELELKSGKVAGLLDYAAKLRAGNALAPSFMTKAERGYALAAKQPRRARRFRGVRLSPELDTAGAFRLIARAALEQIVGNAEILRSGPGPEVIHQMRVGVRRLRSTLSTFKDLVADRRVGALKAELQWLTGELNAARNLDVFLAGPYRQATRRKRDRIGLADLGRNLRLTRTAAYARARSAAESERFNILVMDVLVWLESGPWTAPEARGAGLAHKAVGAFAAEALELRRRKVVRRGRRLDRLDRVQRHKLRIEAKKLRYAADAFQGLFGDAKSAKRFIGTLKILQDRLGQLNDIATGETLAHALIGVAGVAADVDWAAGRLIGEQTAHEGELIEAALTAHRKLKAAPRFWPRRA